MTRSIRHRALISRRRFIKICAAASVGAVVPLSSVQSASVLHRWTGLALGARAEINLLHEDRAGAQKLFQIVESEIRRLETIFSLYRTDSELVRLNRNGCLKVPSHELIELLSVAGRLHAATAGAFDPTVQSLWSCYARAATNQGETDPGDLASAAQRTGFGFVSVDAQEIRYQKSGMAMTLNGIAQGYITDRVAELLTANGCHDVVVDLGEISARGRGPEQAAAGKHGWTVTLRPDPQNETAEVRVTLKEMSVASSARFGTTFDEAGTVSHIIDPRTGHPVANGLTAASVIASSAALADGLSTAALVSGEETLASALPGFPAVRAFLVREDGTTRWLGV